MDSARVTQGLPSYLISNALLAAALESSSSSSSSSPSPFPYSIFTNLSGTTYRYLAREASIQCYPGAITAVSGFFSATNDMYFSPGRCPSSYSPYRADDAPSTDSYSYVCCPSSLTVADVGKCTGNVVAPLNYFLCDIMGKFWPFSAVDTGFTTTYSIEVNPLQVQFRKRDIGLFNFNPSEMEMYGLSITSAPTAASTATETPPVQGTSKPSTTPGASHGLKIGLGAGAIFLGALIVCTVWMCIHSRRKRRFADKPATVKLRQKRLHIQHLGPPLWSELEANVPPQELDGVPCSQLP
ncbi:MAG: hypothetical protein M1814_004902 [Vezdaea aestivalis]|nr:MAG: hypothetical protein M1814_004902 [Vezdaea aestivalis]